MLIQYKIDKLEDGNAITPIKNCMFKVITNIVEFCIETRVNDLKTVFGHKYGKGNSVSCDWEHGST
jgi:hypothetical protein